MADAAIEVPAPRTESVRRELYALGLVDRGRRFEKRAGRVLIPVTQRPTIDLARFGARYLRVPGLAPRPRSRNPREALARALRDAGVPPGVGPSHWEKIGDVVVLTLPHAAEPFGKAIGEACGHVLGARTVVEDVAGISGRLRIPDIRVLWGDGTDTVHVEGGIRYRLDVARVMFSSGNIAERMSIAARVSRGAVVVDLFAGIGYFSVPIAIRANPERVYACELNPVAHGYLLENIRLNRAWSVTPLLGDCKETAPSGVADWVLMGHFDSESRFETAFRALRDEGTVVHHCLTPSDRYPDGPRERVRAAARAWGVEVLSMDTRIVKTYAPGIDHAIVEARVRIPPKGISRLGD